VQPLRARQPSSANFIHKSGFPLSDKRNARATVREQDWRSTEHKRNGTGRDWNWEGLELGGTGTDGSRNASNAKRLP
jgi:hypothetical protein